MNTNTNNDYIQFSDEVALITGSTQGLGKSIAKLFVKRGDRNTG